MKIMRCYLTCFKVSFMVRQNKQNLLKGNKIGYLVVLVSLLKGDKNRIKTTSIPREIAMIQSSKLYKYVFFQTTNEQRFSEDVWPRFAALKRSYGNGDCDTSYCTCEVEVLLL